MIQAQPRLLVKRRTSGDTFYVLVQEGDIVAVRVFNEGSTRWKSCGGDPWKMAAMTIRDALQAPRPRS